MLPRAPCPLVPPAPGAAILRARRYLATAALALMCAWPAPAMASDYFRECKPLGGEAKLELDIEANALRKVKGGPLVPFKIIDKQRLRQVTGTCNTKGQRYKFHTEIFGVTVEFADKGGTVKQKFRCEHAEDATPAGLKCEKEVRTIDFEAPEKLREGYK